MNAKFRTLRDGFDLDPGWPIQAWTLHTAGGGSRRMHRILLMELAMLTTTQIYFSPEQYLEHHGAGAHSMVTPGANHATIDEVIERIENALS